MSNTDIMGWGGDLNLSGVMPAAGSLATSAVSGVIPVIRSATQVAQTAKFAYTHGKDAVKTRDNMPYRFNPPLHPLMRGRGVYESVASGKKHGDLKTEWSKSGRNAADWRLGQIMSADLATVAHKTPGNIRYGFRFLYNPTSITMTSGINEKIASNAVDAGDTGMFLITGGIGVIQMDLLLNRIPDVTRANDALADYGTSINAQDAIDLQAKGTLLDVDYLYRVANGLWEVINGYPVDGVSAKLPVGKKGKGNRKKAEVEQKYDTDPTGDIGVLVPTPAWLSFGTGIRYYGWLQSLSYQHIMFSWNMVPVLTRVQLTFQRILRAEKEEDVAALNKGAAAANYLRGDFFKPVERKTAEDDTGGTPQTGEGEFPEQPKWEAAFLKRVPGPDEAYKNIIAGYRAIRELFPEIKDIGDYRPSDSYGDHPSGLALDIMIPNFGSASGKKLGDKINNYFEDNKGKFGLCYTLWQTGGHYNHIHAAFKAYPNPKNWSGVQNWNCQGQTARGTYWDAAKGDYGAVLKGTPRQMIEAWIPYFQAHGFKHMTAERILEGNRGHGEVQGGGRSYHQGPGVYRWAADISNGSSPTKEMNSLAKKIAEVYGFSIPESGIVMNERYKHYTIQLLYKTNTGGNHFNHVHFGICDESVSPIPPVAFG